MTNSSFVTDTATSVDAWLNEGAAELHDLLVAAYGNGYAVSRSALNVVAGTTAYALPADFLKLLGVDLTVNGQVCSLKKFNHAERNAYRAATTLSWGVALPRYRLEGGNIRLYPSPTAAYTGEIIYAPALALLVAGSDSVNFPNGWEKYVVAYAARIMKSKEESDTRSEEGDLARWKTELEEKATHRDASEPDQVVDVEAAEADPYGIYGV